MIEEVFNWADTSNLTIPLLYSYTDFLTAVTFEGINIDTNLTAQNKHDILQTNKVGLTRPYNFAKDVQKLLGTQIFEMPLNKIDQIIKNPNNANYVKFHMTSAHDTQISNLWQFLEPVGFM